MGKINKTRLHKRENYKLKNWSAYNNSLKQRGKLSIWLSEDVSKGWYYNLERCPGGKIEYSDLAIEFCLTLRHLYNLGYRQTEGFIEDIFSMCSLRHLSVPCYSQIQRRSNSVPINIKVSQVTGKDMVLVLDSTGLKVYGEGEWKVRKHGCSKRRTWRKLHMGSCAESLEILSVSVSGNDVSDAQAGVQMIQSMAQQEKEPIKAVAGDGAYDKNNFRKSLPKDVIQLIPPQRNAVRSKHPKPYLKQRDQAIECIEKIGREQWKKQTGYHKRSLSEVNMFRYKTIFGAKIKAREPEFEPAEVSIKTKILNQFTALGLPDSYKVS